MRRVVVLGGGYAGLHAFSALRSKLRSRIARGDIEVVMVSRDAYHTYHGWTGEVLSGDLPVEQTLTDLRPLVGDAFIEGEVVSADLDGKTLTVAGKGIEQRIAFDELLIAAGSVDPFDRIEGLAEHGWCLKDTHDMQRLAAELDSRTRMGGTRNVVVVGAGFAGIETASALAARFAREGLGKTVVHLVSSTETILPTLRPNFDRIADAAAQRLARQGVQFHNGARVARIAADRVELTDGSVISSDLSVVAAGVSFKVLPGTEALARNGAGQILVDENLKAQSSDHIWVAGDIAGAVHPGTGAPCPTDALWAMAQGDCVGANIARTLKGKASKRFGFKGLGRAAGLAGQTGITELWGLQFSGRIAWAIRVAFFAWFMPSRRGAFDVLMQLGGNLWASGVPIPRGESAPAGEQTTAGATTRQAEIGR